MNNLAISLAVFEVLLVFVHLAVYETLAAAFGIGGVFLGVLFSVLALTFASATALSRFYNNAIVRWYYVFAAYWFGLVNFLFFFGAVTFFLVMAVSYPLGLYPSLPLLGAFCFGAAFLVFLYSAWNSGRAEITKITVTLPNLPASWKGRKIVFVSDVHLGNTRGAAFMAKVTKKIAALEPWALFIGGDLYDGTLCDEKEIVAPLGSLRPPGGSYFISGNHEYYLFERTAPGFVDALGVVGVRVLHNEKIDLDGVTVVGVDDKSIDKKGDLKEILDGITIEGNKPSILLRHIPLDMEVAAQKGFSLAFFGHTHNGQIFPLNLFTKIIYKGYDYGLQKYSSMQTYTSSGVGTWGPPLRLGTKSEIVLVEFD
jgi:predicted MPP superfamily phosphohydrolase